MYTHHNPPTARYVGAGHGSNAGIGGEGSFEWLRLKPLVQDLHSWRGEELVEGGNILAQSLA